MQREHKVRETEGAALLWASWGLGPLAWAAHQNLSYSGLGLMCEAGAPFVLHVISLATLAVAAAGAWLGLREHRTARRRRGYLSEREYGRRRFMAAAGFTLSAFSFAGIVVESLPNFLLPACVGAA